MNILLHTPDYYQTKVQRWLVAKSPYLPYLGSHSEASMIPAHGGGVGINEGSIRVSFYEGRSHTKF